MTRLTKEIRDCIANDCVRTQFKKTKDELTKQESLLAIECYNYVFDEKIRKQAAKMPTKWMRMDGCLMFNAGGYSVTLRVDKELPVPHATRCNRLGNIDGELADKVQDFSNKKQEANDKHKDAYRKLKAMLDSINSIKQLEKTWPEGKPFYKKYMEVKEGSSLPAVQIEDLNKTLGLSK